MRLFIAAFPLYATCINIFHDWWTNGQKPPLSESYLGNSFASISVVQLFNGFQTLELESEPVLDVLDGVAVERHPSILFCHLRPRWHQGCGMTLPSNCSLTSYGRSWTKIAWSQ